MNLVSDKRRAGCSELGLATMCKLTKLLDCELVLGKQGSEFKVQVRGSKVSKQCLLGNDCLL